LKGKRFLFAGVIAIIALIVLCVPVFASPPPGPDVSVTAISPGGGNITVTASSIDTSAFHTGQVGGVSTFNAQGAFTIGYTADAGNFGALTTDVNASSLTGGIAQFTLNDSQNFNVLNATDNTNTSGTYTALVNNSANVSDSAGMYLASYDWGPSTGGWQEASNSSPTYGVGLTGTYVGEQYALSTNAILTAFVSVSATASNGASIGNPVAWGMGVTNAGTSITTNYGDSTNTLTASGSGIFTQYVSANNSATSNATMVVDGNPVVVGGSLPVGGTMTIISNYVNSFVASPYSVTAK
jgi:hypothetical protein